MTYRLPAKLTTGLLLPTVDACGTRDTTFEDTLISRFTWTIPASTMGQNVGPVVVEGCVRTPQGLMVPRSLVNLSGIPERYIVEDCRVDGRKLTAIGHPIQLRPKQEPAVATCWNVLNSGNSAYLVAHPGCGKTVMAIELLRRLGRSAAIVVHKDFLMNQWKERLQEFWPEAKVGICQQKHCDTGEDFDVVLCMMQSLCSRDYPEEFYNSFGVVVFDEAHHLPAQVWSKALYLFPARLYLMLSATPTRTDGLHELQYLQGSRPTYIAKTPDLTPRVETRLTGIRFERHTYVFHGTVNWARMITRLTKNALRNSMIAKDIIAAAKAGRKILVISDRREHLVTLCNLVHPTLPESCTHGFYVGGMLKHDLASSAKCQIIYTTYQMASEGLDIPELSVLIATTPKANMEQSIGRILRVMADKEEPVVVDYQDDIPELWGLGKKRRRLYSALNYKLSEPRQANAH